VERDAASGFVQLSWIREKYNTRRGGLIAFLPGMNQGPLAMRSGP
jgi:hypothetical protein